MKIGTHDSLGPGEDNDSYQKVFQLSLENRYYQEDSLQPEPDDASCSVFDDQQEYTPSSYTITDDQEMHIEYYPLPFQQRKLVKFIFLLLGIGFLLPWNTFVSASAYFERRTLTDDTASNDEKNNFMSWFSLFYNMSGVLTLALMLVWQKRHIILPNWNVFTFSTCVPRRELEWRFIIWSLLFFFLVMILTASMVLIPSLDSGFFQTISLCSAVICGASGAFTSAGIVSFAQIFPPKLGIQPFISGQAVGGVVISILNFALFGLEGTGSDAFWSQHCSTEAMSSPFVFSSSPDDYQIDWGAFAYFTVGCIIIASCIGLFVYLDRAPITRYYRSKNDGPVITQPITTDHVPSDENEIHQILAEPLLNTGEEGNPQTLTPRQEVSSDSWGFLKISASTVFLTFLITITIFPSWITRLESVHECKDKHDRISNDLFIPGLIVLFNMFDLLGRVTAGYTNPNQLLKSGPFLRIGALTRMAFLPIFLLFKAPNHRFPTFLTNDFFPAFFTASLAFTNGWISTLAFTFAALSVPDEDGIQQVSSTILNFAVGLGLMGGSLLSFVYTFIGSRNGS